MDWNLRNNSVRSPLDRDSSLTSTFSPAIAPPSLSSPKMPLGPAPGMGMTFQQRFQALQRQGDSFQSLVADILQYANDMESSLKEQNRLLNQQVHDLQLDVENANQSRRSLQQNLQQVKAQAQDVYDENERIKHHNPYILALIDGDGLIFQEGFIRQGIEGGKKAAYALRNSIAELLGENASQVEIIAKVVANLAGLAKAMRRDGIVEDEATVRDFFLGFSQAKASFDFVDVGYGKERADSKIKEVARWNLRNPNCKHVLLGISHDAGYVPFLDETIQDEKTKRSISILEGVPLVRELRALGLHTLDWTETLFRNDKVGQGGTGPMSMSMPMSMPSPTPMQAATAMSASAPPVSTPARPPSAAPSYANAIQTRGASPPPQITLPLAQSKPPPKRTTSQQLPSKKAQPPWNPGPRGLDPPIPVVPAVLDAIKKRKDGDKLCNNHYLRGPCAKRDVCGFEHNYPANKDEKNAIALLTRLNPCTSGQDCEVEDCIYGHHCPSVKDGVCTHPFCKFKVDEHPPGTKFKNQKIHDN